MEVIEIIGGRIHNLKNISVKIPKSKIVAITGVSGSGKSSLAFDLLFEEGRSRYLQAIGMPPRLESDKPFDMITGLSPTIAVEQRTVRYRNPRSTVGTRTNIYNYLRMLYAACAVQLCPICKDPVNKSGSCDICGMEVEPLGMKHFSFNEPSGMCLSCTGRGYIREFKEEKLVPDPNKDLIGVCEDAPVAFAAMRNWMPSLAKHYGFGLDTPYKKLSKKIKHIFLYGSKGEKMEFYMVSKQYTHKSQKVYEGIIPHLERAMEKSVSDYRRRTIEKKYMDKSICPDCKGFRINDRAREVQIGGKHIGELATMTIDELMTFLNRSEDEHISSTIGQALIEKIGQELNKFFSLGLSYLHLNRPTHSLSGGENQRLSLMTQMNLGLDGCVLILDEPTMGMHELEKQNLADILTLLRDAGNSVLIVEHDEKLISIADEVIDLGPLSGVQGGEVIFQGPLSKIKTHNDSLTGRYLAKKMRYPVKKINDRRKPNFSKVVKLTNISTNNLKKVTVDIPLNIMVGIAGVSGSGKSSLITDTLVPLLKKQLTRNRKEKKIQNDVNDFGNDTRDPLEMIYGQVTGWNQLGDCIIVDQSPIGRNRNSFPASYIGLWDAIRKLFATQPLAKKRKYQEGHFSFNSDKGRCPNCKGEGRVSLAVSFLDEISLPCEECDGTRYIPDILEIEYGGKNIRDVLDLSVTDALEVFKEVEKIVHYLRILDDIGMGYITLGQPATTLSGGEAQRVKLAKALGTLKDRTTLFVLDEPSTGLHFHDEVKLLVLLDKLVDQDNSVVIIEHNPNILRFCDYIVELGPEGGPKGGQVLATGTPEKLVKNKTSLIGPFLRGQS
jgi:excinuclease ABC A subunit